MGSDCVVSSSGVDRRGVGPRGGGSNSRLVSSRPTNPSDGHPHAVSFENHYDTHSFFADVVVRTCTHGDRFLAAREREGVAVSRAAAMIEREREKVGEIVGLLYHIHRSFSDPRHEVGPATIC